MPQSRSQSLLRGNIGSEVYLISGMMLLQRVTMPLTDTSCSMSSGFRSLITFFCRRLNTFACTRESQSTIKQEEVLNLRLAVYLQDTLKWPIVYTQSADTQAQASQSGIYLCGSHLEEVNWGHHVALDHLTWRLTSSAFCTNASA